MDDLIKFIERHGGGIGVMFNDGNHEWTVAVEFGREAADSDMAGGASYGIGESLDEALLTVRQELGLGG